MHWILSGILGVGAAVILLCAVFGLIAYAARGARLAAKTGKSLVRSLDGPPNLPPPRRPVTHLDQTGQPPE